MAVPPTGSPPPLATEPTGQRLVQRVVKVRRDYNSWVARETLEDYALRFTPRSFRKWTELRVANTAFGAASFLVLEAVGATMMVQAGFLNAFWAILATGLIIFLAGLPISHYAARYGVDMDLLTRGAGFGYIGSTITSLIYASFTFIFFALEAAIMAYALELGFQIPPALGYLICALVVIPLVTHGVTAISRLQAWTQPLWLVMLVAPYLFLLLEEPGVLAGLWAYPGAEPPPGGGEGFSVQRFGAALTVGIALITQMGEQADYLRFMPEQTPANRRRWWLGLVIGGPGWVLPGIAKMLGGALLAYLALRNAIPADRAVDPNQMYLIGFSHVFSATPLAIAATALFVVISQIKINVTNAYAGSLAWSNFFARLTHSHPGRVVWVVFNTLIALMLMELDVFRALGQVLGLYSNIAISWIMAVVADLVINKPLGLSPPGIEFKRSHLYDINPVGVGAMAIASGLSIPAYVGMFGTTLQAFAPFIAIVAALVAAPLIARLTRGRYYLARPPSPESGLKSSPGAGTGPGSLRRCVVCEREYEADDMAHCPAYQGDICSLCCSLDARCNDLCKPEARLSAQWARLLQRLLPSPLLPYLETGLGHYLLLMLGIIPFLALLLGLIYYQEIQMLPPGQETLLPRLQEGFIRAFAALLLVAGIVAWWLVLTYKSRQVAQEESNRQTQALVQEIESHRQTDLQLQKARQVAEQANQAKSRYITSISHELRTPLNSILGYAQILDGDPAIPTHRQPAIRVIRRSGDHLLSLIEGTLDIARIEGGKLTLETRPLAFPDFIAQIVGMFELQARNKGIQFRYEGPEQLPPVVRADEKRLRQILINVLGNGVKFTAQGEVTFRLRYQREMAIFEIQDTGPGISPEELERIFEPFVRGRSAQGGIGGTGLGLTISKMLTNLMGGEMNVTSVPGEGSLFRIRLFLPRVYWPTHGPTHSPNHPAGTPEPSRSYLGYLGIRRRILVVDNERTDRELLCNVLEPLGFQVAQAASGEECLALVPGFQPHLIFMDLAMPGIDGWETLRRLRGRGETQAKLAVLSANAYEKGLAAGGSDVAAEVGIGDADFILKPFQVSELLAWIGRRLELEWVHGPADARPPAEPPGATPAPENTTRPSPLPMLPAAPTASPWVLPPEPRLRALDELIALGYVRGILKALDELEGENPDYLPLTQALRGLARQFQFEAMQALIRPAPVNPQPAP